MNKSWVWMALGFAAGIAAQRSLGLPPLGVWATAAGAAAAVAMARRAPRSVRLGGVIAVVFLLGMVRAGREPTFPAWLLRRAAGLSQVTGTVATYPGLGSGSLTFTMRTHHLPGDIQVSWRTETPVERLIVGDVVGVSGRAKLPGRFEGFDYAAYLARRGVFVTLFAEEVVRLDGRPGAHWLLRWGDRVRQGVVTRLREQMPPEAAALAQSLLFGDRSALPEEMEEAFSGTGLMHLLAVSGLHLGILLGGVWWGLRWIGVRPRVAYPIVSLLVGLALLVVGPRVSLVRAALLFMFLGVGSVLADAGWILRRWVHPLNGLAAAAVVLLLLRPGALYDAGFQLTVAATGSILVALSPSGWGTRVFRAAEVRAKPRWVRWLVQALVVSLAAQAGAAPILAGQFRSFHPFAVLLNPVVVPWAAATLWAGLFAVPWLGTPLGWLGAGPFVYLVRGLGGWVGLLSGIPGVALTVVPVMGVWMAGSFGCILLADYALSSSRTSNSTSITSESTESMSDGG
jgi:competence protein ComEC